MTTTRAAPEAVLPPARTEMQRLAERAEETEARALAAADAAWCAEAALVGKSGADFRRALDELVQLRVAESEAVGKWKTARNALLAALNQPRED